jgi:hypothetical protein
MRKILYIAGAGRSGSTVLDMYLTRYYSLFSVGELSNFFDRALLKGELCACGAPFDGCGFWSEVVRVLGKEDLLRNAGRYAELTSRFDGIRNFPASYRDFGRTASSGETAEYLALTERLLNAIFQVLGPEAVLVDSSKVAARALGYRQLQGFDVYTLHLVREAAGSAYSWTQKKRRPEASHKGGDAFMVRIGYGHALLRWARYNLYASLIRNKSPEGRYLYMRYEDFVDTPDSLSERIVSFVGGTDPSWQNRWGYHSISGNPVRLGEEAGEITIKPDDRWKTGLPWWKKGVASALSLPLSLYMQRR